MVPREGTRHLFALFLCFLLGFSQPCSSAAFLIRGDLHLTICPGVSAIENLLSSWSGASSKQEDDAGSSDCSSSEDSEYVDSDDESASDSSSSGGGDGSDSDSSSSSSSSSSDASDIDRSELEALLDESRDVLADGAGGSGRPTKRLRR
jgi:hypothetical protein